MAITAQVVGERGQGVGAVRRPVAIAVPARFGIDHVKAVRHQTALRATV